MSKGDGGYGGPGGSESTSFSAGFGEDGPSGAKPAMGGGGGGPAAVAAAVAPAEMGAGSWLTNFAQRLGLQAPQTTAGIRSPTVPVQVPTATSDMKPTPTPVPGREPGQIASMLGSFGIPAMTFGPADDPRRDAKAFYASGFNIEDGPGPEDGSDPIVAPPAPVVPPPVVPPPGPAPVAPPPYTQIGIGSLPGPTAGLFQGIIGTPPAGIPPVGGIGSLNYPPYLRGMPGV